LADRGNQDSKLEQVKGFIKTRLARNLKERKLLLFSYFRETAEYIYKAITEDKGWLREVGDPRIEIITGNTDGERRSTIVRQFAPFSNRPQEEESEGWQPPAKQIDVLISTDVLSEGQNLQDCGDLLNYDLHWNPVRMIQRAGRINRLKALHDPVYVYNCYPDKELNNFLRIVERLQQRVRDIDQSVGLDHSVMGEVISEKSFEQLRRIRERDAQVIEELEQQAELVTAEDMKLPLQMFMKEVGEEELRQIPLGIRSAREGPIKGTFLAFKAPAEDREHHYWRFYPDGAQEPLTDMREIFQVIRCDKNTPRVNVPDPENSEREDRRFDVVEQATNDIIKVIKGQRGIASRPYHMRTEERNYYQAIENPLLGEEIDSEVRERVMRALETGTFRSLHLNHEWRELRRQWRSGQNGTEWLAATLDELAVTSGLYNDASFGPLGALRAVQEERLRLVCYELVV
jgi:superfamily II DNA/RNA helicase